MTNNPTPAEWADRKERAREYMRAWRAERDEAVSKKRPMKELPYDYTRPVRGAGGEGE